MIRLKKLAVKIRKLVKVAVILTVSVIFILGLIQFIYKQTYSVSLNGEIIGYTNDKIALQKRINSYINSGNGSDIAFVELTNMPTYKVCLLKKNIETNDDEIFEKVASLGTNYYKYYAITDEDDEKVYVASFQEAEDVISNLKEKNSNNIEDLGIVEKYNTEVNGLSSVDESVSSLYEEKPATIQASNTSAYQQVAKTIISGNSVNTNIGITLIQPVSGTISSRFGNRSRDNPKGLDIAAPKGTAIKAAASGTVIFSGSGAPYSGYGNVVVVRSTSSVVIIYGHCSKLYMTAGQSVSQGQVIAAVGSTGISTGNHLHFEIRYNGTAINPQNYIY